MRAWRHKNSRSYRDKTKYKGYCCLMAVPTKIILRKSKSGRVKESHLL